MEEAEKMSDRIGFIKNGKLIKIGKVEEYKNIINKKRLEILFNNMFSAYDKVLVSDMMNQIKLVSHCD